MARPSTSAARAIWDGEGSSGRGVLTSSGTRSSGTGSPSMSSGMARNTAPGRSVWASLNALRTISGTDRGLRTMSAHLVTGENIDTRSTL